MTPTILADRAAGSADKTAGTLVRSLGEFNGAVARLMFPAEGYSRADMVGLTTELQLAALRLWLAAVETPVRMIAGASLPPRPDAAALVSTQPGLKKPLAAKVVASKAAATKPSVPLAKAPPALTPSSDKAGAVVVPFRRADPARPQAVIADADIPSRAKAPPPAPKSLAPKSLAPKSLAPKSLAPKSLAPKSLAPKSLAPKSLAPESLAPKSLASAKPSNPMKSSSGQSALAKPGAAEPAASKPVPPSAAASKSPTAAKSIDPLGDFDDASVSATSPAFLAGPEGKADDLLIIKGVGPKLNQLLHDLGIWHYRQIANWTPGEIAWINAKLDFKGRVQRERWVRQARELAGQSAA